MADESLAELLKTQQSLTEWLEDIKHSNAEELRHEDNLKRERLGDLNRLISLPYDKPVQFVASELTETNAKFRAYLRKHGNDLCALRLIPKEKSLPKLRMRGKTVQFAYQWYQEQGVNPAKYLADFVPHPPDYSWSTIFIVNKFGIQGEIVFGGHHLLTQGFYGESRPITFRYDFKNWTMSEKNSEALSHLQKLAAYLYVPDSVKQKEIGDVLQGEFEHDYLAGYFETTDSSVGTWFIDYNRILGRMYSDTLLEAQPSQSQIALLVGKVGSRGIATGSVQIVAPNNLDLDFAPGSILVCQMTTPNFVPLMKKASAIVTDQGGILSHAAIVARELGKPCIVGTLKATTKLKNGDKVEVNANEGTVILL
jgi:phosphohistidine swiveling domain-containing protein